MPTERALRDRREANTAATCLSFTSIVGSLKIPAEPRWSCWLVAGCCFHCCLSECCRLSWLMLAWDWLATKARGGSACGDLVAATHSLTRPPLAVAIAQPLRIERIGSASRAWCWQGTDPSSGPSRRSLSDPGFASLRICMNPHVRRTTDAPIAAMRTDALYTILL